MKAHKPILSAAVGLMLAASVHAAPKPVVIVRPVPAVHTQRVVVVPARSTVHRARISRAVARERALARYPGMKVRSVLLQQRSSRLVYVLELFNARQPGLTLVTVDAYSGTVLSVDHVRRR
jgi:peptidase YpeB-like protein